MRCTQDRKAFHRLDLADTRPADVRARPDRQHPRIGKCALRGVDETRGGSNPVRHEAACERILVHRFRADHELRDRNAASPGDSHMEERIRSLRGERGHRRCRSFDRTDAARERHHTGAGAGELPGSGRDDEDHPATVAVSPGRVNGCKDRRAPASSDGAARSPVPLKGDFFETPARSGHLRHLKVKAPLASRP